MIFKLQHFWGMFHQFFNPKVPEADLEGGERKKKSQKEEKLAVQAKQNQAPPLAQRSGCATVGTSQTPTPLKNPGSVPGFLGFDQANLLRMCPRLGIFQITCFFYII